MPAIGENLSHYRIVGKLGQGGMGVVYLAWDTSLERNVALKFLLPDLQQDAIARQRFLREARSAATLDHPHICVVHEVSEVEGTPFIVMEYIDGESLRQRLSRGAPSLDEALHVGAEIAEALAEAHSKRIVHRDLKPANVMIARTGHVKVMDFGLAKRALSTPDAATEEQTHTELTHAGTTIGTLAYMAPEQLAGQPADHRSDIFAFGILLYEMVAGVHPFRRETETATTGAILHEEPAPLAQHAPTIPVRLASLVAEMLAKAPDRRPQSMRGIHDQLREVLLDERSGAGRAGAQLVGGGAWSLKVIARALLRPRVAIPIVAFVLALVFLGVRFFDHQARVRWARNEALPEIERLIGNNDVWRNLGDAYKLAEKAEAYVPQDPELARLLSQCSVRINIDTKPSGAKIFMQSYMEPKSEWTYLGVSPIEKVRVPIGVFRWRIEKEGYETVLAAGSTWNIDLAVDGLIIPYDLVRTLDKSGSVPPGMVRVEGEQTNAGRLDDFYIDRTEVTNRQYKAFVDDGGYKNRKFWIPGFVKDGKLLTWEQAMAEFVDQSGQPGPATWQAGDYPEGQGEYPVSGVSWYEAAAYAEYAGKSLPTGTHWGLASGETTPLLRFPQLGGLAVFAPFSNFNGKGPVAVGTLHGITAYGASDMAGNVREWCWNETPKGRLIRGGAWLDNTYMFGSSSQASPFDRSHQNGFRCARYPDPATVPAAALQALAFSEPRDAYREKAVSDAVFQVYKEQFSYDKTDLKSRVESRQESPGGWIQEKVSFDAAYGGERVAAYLFLPENAAPPYQAVVYFPGSASEYLRSSQNIESYYEFSMFLSFIVKSGRAVVYPVYKGTFERGTDSTTAAIDTDMTAHRYAEILIQEVKDLRRCLDYVETRPDLDSRKIAYYGMSWGAALGAVTTAVEDRFKASVLVGGGFLPPQRPEVDQINYVGRVKTPTLMLNGTYDTLVTAEMSSKPMFVLLGTAAGDKQQKFYDTDHIPPRNELIKETLAWLDRYLGPVKQ